MFYGFVNDRIVGRLHLRHRLNEALAIRGGRIGYAVSPPYRGRGYACEMLRLGLREVNVCGVTGSNILESLNQTDHNCLHDATTR